MATAARPRAPTRSSTAEAERLNEAYEAYRRNMIEAAYAAASAREIQTLINAKKESVGPQ